MAGYATDVGPHPFALARVQTRANADVERFQCDAERCEEPPAPTPGTVVGTYGIFD